MSESDDIQKSIDLLNQKIETLDVEIIDRRATREGLNKDIATLTTSKEELHNNIVANNVIKRDLDIEINQKNDTVNKRNATLTQLDNDIASRTITRDGLNNEVKTLTTSKEDLHNNINTNSDINKGLTFDISLLEINKGVLNEDITKLAEKKKELEENVKLLREKNDLFSNDIAGISEDSSTQRTKYAIGIGLSFLVSLTFMIILICSVKGEIKLSDGIKEDLAGNPRLLFMTFLLVRISIVGTLFTLIFVFINLTRGFVSQFIRTQEKMTAVRLLDYLVSKIGKEKINGINETEFIKLETEKLDKQKLLLNEHLPKLIEYNPSTFDKLSNAKNATDILAELLEKGKVIVPTVPEKTGK